MICHRLHNIAPADHSNQSTTIQHRVAAVYFFDETLRYFQNRIFGMDRYRLRAHVILYQSAGLAVIIRMENHTQAVSLGQHANQAPMLIKDRRTGNIVFNEHP